MEEQNHKPHQPHQVMKATDVWDDQEIRDKRLYQKMRLALFSFLLIGVFFEVGYFTTITFLLIYGRWELDRYDDIKEMAALRMWIQCFKEPNFRKEFKSENRVPKNKG